jgi:predicted TIM-barrel fold metal-dependent hydrolase
MTDLGFAAFDADNHYYEAEDAFTRHLDPKMAKRTMQWGEISGKKRLLVAGAVNRFIPNPTFDPIARPGCLDDYFRGNAPSADIREAFGALEPMSDRPEYRNRDARLALMDKQGIEAMFMFPTLGVGMESVLETDIEAMGAAFRSFNRWLLDDWQLGVDGRIITAVYISLADPQWALDELDWALSNGCRLINLRANSVYGVDGRRSLGHPLHDAFWKKVNDSGITVSFHSGDSGYGFMSDHWGLSSEFEAFRYDPLRSLLNLSPIADTMASLIAEGVLTKNPDIRVATIETGSSWVGPLFKRMKKAYSMHTHAFDEDPCKTFARQIWVSPYYEDDLFELRDLIGADHMLFGSDYPHAEGLAEPASFVHDLTGFNEAEIKLIMRENGSALAKRAL